MNASPSKIALAALVAATLSACGGGSSGSGGGGNGDDNDDGNGNGNGDGSGFINFQTDFSATNRYNVIESPAGFSINSNTLAINTTETIDAGFNGPFVTPAGQAVTSAPYFGAVNPAAANADDNPTNGGPFWDGWTIRDPAIEGNLPSINGNDTFHPLQAEIEGGTLVPAGTNDCANIAGGLTAGNDVTIFGEAFPVCVIRDGDLDGDYTLTNDHVYILDGTVQVGNGDVESAHNPATVREDILTIEPGTQIFGVSDTDPSLVITRGSLIDADGTPDLPIIFAAVDANNGSGTWTITDDPTDLGGRGRWGSLVISGYGEINNGDDNNQTTTEAVPDGVTRWFGGTDNNDSSGTIRYVVLAETGEAFRPDEEVQGLTIEGSGSGTTIEYVQVTNSDDDGIEWFGGAASASYVVVQGVSDDSLDMDLGFQGTIQYALVIMGDQHGDRAIESDNNGSAFGALPKTSPVIANLTIIGDAGNGGATDANTMGALHREGFGGQVYRAVYTDNELTGAQFDLGCLDVDDELDEDLEYGDVIFNCDAGSLVNDTD